MIRNSRLSFLFVARLPDERLVAAFAFCHFVTFAAYFSTDRMRFKEDVVDESVAMQPMHPALFDDYLAEGWRLLGYSIIRHSLSICRGVMCGTVPLRQPPSATSRFDWPKTRRKCDSGAGCGSSDARSIGEPPSSGA